VVTDDGRAPSRRALLTGTGTALAGGALTLAGGLALAGCGAAAGTTTSATPQPGDVQILGQALELERHTVAAYVAGIPLMARPQRRAFRQFLNEELQHTGELISLIKAAGGKAAARADSYALGHPTDAAGVLALLHSLETLQISSYRQWIPRLSTGPVRAAAASILTVDAQHLTMVRVLQDQDPVPAAFVTGAQ
jgi:hypothetical protein